MYSTISSEIFDGFAKITLQRPDKLNALNAQLLQELGACLTELSNNHDIHAVIITGSGAKAFAAGADIEELHSCDANTGEDFALRGQRVFNQIEFFGRPVIAAVNGFALGGGCELALACHIRFASDNAKFGQPEVNLGILPGFGGTQRLTRVVGRAKSAELILSGNIISAAEAKEIGLVNSVVPQSELMAHVEKFVQTILSKSQPAIKASLEAILNVDELSPAEGLKLEAKLFGETCGTPDFKEGTKAFLEKRPAKFSHSK